MLSMRSKTKSFLTTEPRAGVTPVASIVVIGSGRENRETDYEWNIKKHWNMFSNYLNTVFEISCHFNRARFRSFRV